MFWKQFMSVMGESLIKIVIKLEPAVPSFLPSCKK